LEFLIGTMLVLAAAQGPAASGFWLPELKPYLPPLVEEALPLPVVAPDALVALPVVIQTVKSEPREVVETPTSVLALKPPAVAGVSYRQAMLLGLDPVQLPAPKAEPPRVEAFLETSLQPSFETGTGYDQNWCTAGSLVMIPDGREGRVTSTEGDICRVLAYGEGYVSLWTYDLIEPVYALEHPDRGANSFQH
jgi:hypothetical protein